MGFQIDVEYLGGERYKLASGGKISCDGFETCEYLMADGLIDACTCHRSAPTRDYQPLEQD